jgi:hypothetical protein
VSKNARSISGSQPRKK